MDDSQTLRASVDALRTNLANTKRSLAEREAECAARGEDAGESAYGRLARAHIAHLEQEIANAVRREQQPRFDF